MYLNYIRNSLDEVSVKLKRKIRYKQFSVTQKCPIDCFAPKTIQYLDICDNCKWGAETYKGSRIVNCTKQKLKTRS